jgi:hypothetical protein
METGLPANKAVIPGFSEDGMSILNPTAFVESILKNNLHRSAVFRTPNPPTFLPRQTTVPETLVKFPNIEQSYSPIFSGILDEQISENKKSYLQIPNFGSFTRISASGVNNCCWFDSFLTCISPAYRSLSLEQRQSVFPVFRKWCNTRKTKILAEKPSYLDTFYTDDEFINDTGFIIAWYFGVNIIYIKFEESGPVIDTTMSIQSPDCQTIFMIHLGGTGAGAHYEPVGILGLNDNQTLNEATSTFVFDWNNRQICQMQNLPTTWSLPICLTNNSGSVRSANTNNTAARASVGGKRRGSRRTKKRMGKKRRGTRRH